MTSQRAVAILGVIAALGVLFRPTLEARMARRSRLRARWGIGILGMAVIRAGFGPDRPLGHGTTPLGGRRVDSRHLRQASGAPLAHQP